MTKFEQTAVDAVNILLQFQNQAQNKPITFEDAWKQAAQNNFSKKSARNKFCPKKTFTGLCEAGYIQGIAGINSIKNSVNKNYGIVAVNLLKNNNLTLNKSASAIRTSLWRLVVGTKTNGKPSKIHNQQMDVVAGLWDAGLII